MPFTKLARRYHLQKHRQEESENENTPKKNVKMALEFDFETPKTRPRRPLTKLARRYHLQKCSQGESENESTPMKKVKMALKFETTEPPPSRPIESAISDCKSWKRTESTHINHIAESLEHLTLTTEDISKQTKAAKTKISQSKAVVTPAVLASFKRIFEGLIDNAEDKKSKTKRRCNICENCMKKDCGQCTYCKDMIKFGGTGKSKQACEKRACNNMVEKQFDNEVSDDEDEKIQETISTPKKEDEVDKEDDNGKANLSDKAKLKNQMKIKNFTINFGEKLKLSDKTMKFATTNRYSMDGFSFTKEPIGYINGRAVYDTVLVGKELWKQGDCIYHGRDIGQVVYFYQNKKDKFCAHLRMFLKGNETVLKEMADEHELFVSKKCRRILLDQIEVSF